MSFRVERVSFVDAEEAIRLVRQAVFVIEQKVPIELEWDGSDRVCQHVVAWDEQENPIGTGRLTPEDHIGRMAVLESWRGRGVGHALMQELMQVAFEQGRPSLALNAQTYAVPFYERYGFVAEGEEFMEAGIPHRRMVLRELAPSRR
ncbi:GNAT family N-acetyltransferase [Myxococcota bacterium]